MRSVVGEIDESLKKIGFHFKQIDNDKRRVYIHPNGAILSIANLVEADTHRKVVEEAKRLLGRKQPLSVAEKKARSLHKIKRGIETHEVIPAWQLLQMHGDKLGLNLTRVQCVALIRRFGDYREAKKKLTRLSSMINSKEDHGIHGARVQNSSKRTHPGSSSRISAST